MTDGVIEAALPRKKPRFPPGFDLFRVRRASQFPLNLYKSLGALVVSADVLMYNQNSRQTQITCVVAVNEAYVLMAIILCVWLLIKLLPGMEP